MNRAVLVFGEEFFSNFLLATIQEIANIEVVRINTFNDLETTVQSGCPGLILLQLEPAIWPWIERFRQKAVHRGVYCLIVDTQGIATTGPLIYPIEQATKSLAAGANAYCWVGDNYNSMDETNPHLKLLKAQLKTGLDHVQHYLELAEVNDLLSAIALSDGLTQLGNRRAFDWELPRQIQIARTQNLPLCLLMLDIDRFKQVNDTYGHVVGDQVLQVLAERLRYNLRFYETLFRYGGEEFVIILNNTVPEEALQICQRLRQVIGQQPFVIGDAIELLITISLGMTSLNSEDDPQGDSLLGRADQNLLRAKKEGRDRIVHG